MNRRKKKLLLIAPLAILGVVLFVYVGGELVMYLWNWLLPPLFAWRPITFWQALGILLLCRILFGGSGWRHSARSNFRHRMADRMADRMAERSENMTPEERERFLQRVRERWGCGPSASENKGQ